MRLQCHPEERAQRTSQRATGLGYAVLKLDSEGDRAARRAEFLELSNCEEQRRFFILERG
jgi:hypothetical protein